MSLTGSPPWHPRRACWPPPAAPAPLTCSQRCTRAHRRSGAAQGEGEERGHARITLAPRRVHVPRSACRAPAHSHTELHTRTRRGRGTRREGSRNARQAGNGPASKQGIWGHTLASPHLAAEHLGAAALESRKAHFLLAREAAGAVLLHAFPALIVLALPLRRTGGRRRSDCRRGGGRHSNGRRGRGRGGRHGNGQGRGGAQAACKRMCAQW